MESKQGKQYAWVTLFNPSNNHLQIYIRGHMQVNNRGSPILRAGLKTGSGKISGTEQEDQVYGK